MFDLIKEKKVNKRELIKDKETNLFSNENFKEKERLSFQQSLLYEYDIEVYNKYLDHDTQYYVLDLGCNNGDTSFNRFKNFNIGTYVGIDIDQNSIKQASINYGKDNVHFFCLDLEDSNFEKILSNILNKLNVKFDIVNCLALFAHLKYPVRLLETVKKFCKKNALFFIRNIDDGFNISYGSKDIEKGLKFLDKTKFTGFRYSGREICNIFAKANITNLNLEKNGICNVGLTKEKKLALFHTIFDIVKNSLVKEKELGIITSTNLQRLKWLENRYKKIETDFLKPEVFINIGFMFYVAKF